jgi:AAA15 family ATPase/GTPase
MKLIHYVKLHNFKVFGDEKTIELDQPSVLIGPNNSGKTSTLQALALWSIGLKRWNEVKGNSKALKNVTTGINRLDIIQVPVQEAKYFWKNTEIRKGSNNYIPLDITVGVEFEGKVHECKMTFTHYTPEVIYCAPEKNFYQNKKLLEYSSSIVIEILYPMSGMITDETLLPEGRINVLIGQGRTAEVLRNLCYQIIEKDKEEKTNLWNEVVGLMKQLFNIELLEPTFIKSRGAIELKYNAPDVKNPLDISLSGRGQQQTLLLISYLYSHRNSILLLDEPDAHLEILRQKLVFTLLRDLSLKNNNQVIIATHSEVILEEALDTNLVMLIDGEPLNIALKKNIRSALKNFGIEHYYKAKLKKNILYIEGSTDVQILKEFARILERTKLISLLESPINYYYVQNNEPVSNHKNMMDTKQGYFGFYKEHFYAIKSVVPEFKGLAIFDSDGIPKVFEPEDSLTTFYWTLYEIENYFINPNVIIDYVTSRLRITSEGPLFMVDKLELFKNSLNQTMLSFIFDNNNQALTDFIDLSPSLQDVFWQNTTKSIKLSTFLENVFQKYSVESGQPILLNKGRFFELIKFLPPLKISKDIITALDLVEKYIS